MFIKVNQIIFSGEIIPIPCLVPVQNITQITQHNYYVDKKYCMISMNDGSKISVLEDLNELDNLIKGKLK